MKKGFSLVEVLTASLIGVIVMAGIALFLIVSSRVNNRIMVKAKAQNNLTLISAKIANQIKIAENVKFINNELVLFADGVAFRSYKVNNSVLQEKGATGSYQNLLTFDNCAKITLTPEVYNNNTAVLSMKLDVDYSGEKYSVNNKIIAKCRKADYYN